jgi:hypothetical protein
MHTRTHVVELLLDFVAYVPARGGRVCQLRPFRANPKCLLPCVECAMVSKLYRVWPAIKPADATLLQCLADLGALHIRRIRAPAACRPENHVKPHRPSVRYVLAHALPLFSLLAGNQRKNVDAARRLTLSLVKFSKISPCNGHALRRCYHQGNCRLRLLLFIKVAQGLFVTLADGKSDP